MQCQRCNKKKATVFYRENIGGRVKALRLCGDCAEVLEQAGELEDMGTVLSVSPSPLLPAEEGASPLPLVPGTTDKSSAVCPHIVIGLPLFTLFKTIFSKLTYIFSLFGKLFEDI